MRTVSGEESCEDVVSAFVARMANRHLLGDMLCRGAVQLKRREDRTEVHVDA
jgi:hypothetical protein